MTFRGKIVDADNTPFVQFLSESMEKIMLFLGDVRLEVGVTEEPQIIEGSIVEPVTDPTRLLPAKEVEQHE